MGQQEGRPRPLDRSAWTRPPAWEQLRRMSEWGSPEPEWGSPEQQFLYKLPSSIMCEFYSVMDSLDNADWGRFASCIVTDVTELRLLENKGAPGRTQNVMWYWMNRNGTVGQLLHILTNLNLRRPRDIILSWRPTFQPPPPSVAPARMNRRVCPPPAEPLPAPVPPSSWSDPVKSHSWKPSEQETLTMDAPFPKPVLPGPPTPPHSTSTDAGNSGFSGKDSLSKAAASTRPPSSSSVDKYLFYWPLHELKQGTYNFAASQKIGEGGFGCVYRAVMRHTEYAVKRLKEDSDLDWNTVRGSFQTELEKLYRYRHPNIVDLAGCCVEDAVYCLVYVYMPHGSLHDRLQCQNGSSPLSWLRRLDVALGAARAIQFLHSSNPSLIHGDVKSSNILLDANFVVKLGDFGLARFSRYSNNSGKSCTVARTQKLQGTLAYLPDEYIKSGQLTVELDTYSFGVVLLEILTGRKALENDGFAKPKYLKDIIDEEEAGCADAESLAQTSAPTLHNQRVAALICQKHLDPKAGVCPGHIPMQLCLLACECLSRRRKSRPKMAKVYERLVDLRKAPWAPEGERPLPSPSEDRDWDADSVADRLRSTSLSPMENTYRFASQAQAAGGPARRRTDTSQRYPASERLFSPSTPACSDLPSMPEASDGTLAQKGWDASSSLQVPQRPQVQHGHTASSTWTSRRSEGSSRPEGPTTGSIPSYTSLCQPVESNESSMDDGGGASSSRRGLGSPSPQLRAWDPAFRPPQPELGSAGGSWGVESPSPSDTTEDSPLPSRQIVVNPAKQRILEQFALYNAGHIDSGELLSSLPVREGWSGIEQRAPEESDDFDEP